MAEGANSTREGGSMPDDTLADTPATTTPAPAILPPSRRRAVPRWFTALAVVLLVLAPTAGWMVGAAATGADQLPVAEPENPVAQALEEADVARTSTTSAPFTEVSVVEAAEHAEQPASETRVSLGPDEDTRVSSGSDAPPESGDARVSPSEPATTTTTVAPAEPTTTTTEPATTAEPTPWDSDPDWCKEPDATTHRLPDGGWRCALTDGTFYDWHPG